MATLDISVSATPRASSWIQRHPIVAYFVIAYTGTWLVFSPILFSKRGLGSIDLPGSAAFLLFILATYTGPFLSALVTTSIIDGKAGVRAWLHRIVQWRVNIKWYLLVLIGYPIIFFIPAIAELGAPGLNAATQNMPKFVVGYLTTIPIGFFLPTLGEETGWRGFALPRLQSAYSPLLASLILGIMHAIWHLPSYFVNGMLATNGFDPNFFVANSLGIVAGTFLWTWLFNNTQTSIFFATFVHAAGNAAGSFLAKSLNVTNPDPWFAFEVLGVVAVVLIIWTRGRLGFNPARERIETD